MLWQQWLLLHSISPVPSSPPPSSPCIYPTSPVKFVKIRMLLPVELEKWMKALQFDMRCKAIGRYFDHGCGFLYDTFNVAAFNMALPLQKRLRNFSLKWTSFLNSQMEGRGCCNCKHMTGTRFLWWSTACEDKRWISTWQPSDVYLSLKEMEIVLLIS